MLRKKDLLEKPYDELYEIIIHLYYKSEPIKKTELANLLSLSLPTLNEYLEILSEVFYEERFDNDIGIVQENGYITLKRAHTFPIKRVISSLLEHSIKYHMILDLYNENFLDWNYFQKKYEISSTTYYRRLNELNDLLSEFNVFIKGGQLVGEEKQIRYFFYCFFWFLFENKSNFSIQTTNQFLSLIDSLQTNLNILFDNTEILQIKLWMKIAFKRHSLKKSQLSNSNLDNLDRPLFKEIDTVFRFYTRNNDRFYSLKESQFFYDFFCSQRNFHLNSNFANRLAEAHNLSNSYLWYMVDSTIEYLNKVGLTPSAYPDNKMCSLKNLMIQFYAQLYYFNGFIQVFDDNYENHQQTYPVLVEKELIENVRSFCEKKFKYPIGSKFKSSSVNLNLLVILNHYAELDNNVVKIGVAHSLNPFLTDMVINVTKKYLGDRYPVLIESFRDDNYYNLLLSNISNENISNSSEYFYIYHNHTSLSDLRNIRDIVDRIVKKRF